MSIDYSQPGYKEMFANYGLTAMAALSLEKTLLLLVAAIDNLGNGNLPKEKLHEYLANSESGKPMKKRNMGDLIRDVASRMNISTALEADLKEANKSRNSIIHHFFVDKYETLTSPLGPVALSNELRPIRDLFLRIQTEIDHHLSKVCDELRKPQAEISQNLRMLLKEKQVPL